MSVFRFLSIYRVVYLRIDLMCDSGLRPPKAEDEEKYGNHDLPKYVVEEFYRYLDCGILAR
jgi:hypothetical protein